MVQKPNPGGLEAMEIVLSTRKQVAQALREG